MTTSHHYKNLYPRGSEWRRWDLHIHSPLSILNNQYPKLQNGNPDWEAFVTKLESLDDIAVIGITDYFTIDGYKKVKEFKQAGRLANTHTILPNIEFRLNSVISSKKDGQTPRRLNFHVIFSDKVSTQDIEEHFLHDLHFFYEGNPQDRDDTRKLKRSNIEMLGKRLIEEHKTFKESGLSPLQIGAMQTVVNHEDITKCLKDKRFKGKYLLVFPEELSNLIDWDGQDHHTRKGLLQKSDMVFSSNERTRAWCLGKGPYTEGVDKFLKEFKTCKPCIHGSDAHKLEEVGHPCALKGESGHQCHTGQECELRHCWIKADPTFEGLKQLLYEPSDRVIIQSKNPTPVKSNYSLEGFKISQAVIAKDLSVQETSMDLNCGLVAVTGGKGSGKTAFVDLIANCYVDRCNTNDANSFVRRIVDENPTIDTTVQFKDGSQFQKGFTDGTFFEDTELVYIAQGELENYISDDSDLDVYIRNLIFESPQVKDTVLSFDFSELLGWIDDLEKKISIKNEAIIDYEKQTSAESLQGIALEAKKRDADLKDVVNRLEALKKVQSKENIETAQEKQKKIAELKSRKDDLMHLKELLTKALTFFENDLTLFNEHIAAVNTLLTKLGIAETFKSISYDQKGQFEQRLSSTKTEVTKIVAEIEGAQKHLETFEAGIKDHAKLLERKRELDAEIEHIKTKLTEFKKKEQQLEQFIEVRKDLFKQLIHTVMAQKKKYEDVISAFSAQKAEVLSDLDFGAKINFDQARFLMAAEDVMDNRRITITGKEQGDVGMCDNLINIVDSLLGGDENYVDKLVAEVEKLTKEYQGKLKRSHAITMSDFYTLLYGNYFSVIPTVRYKNTRLSKLSLGQKATVLIKIYLAQGDKPIIIDSHDEHLDNEFIMDELVNAIRQAKGYRQIILASNNGNVVINSDAEQIIVANIKDGVISYTSGSIENPTIRDRAVEVLEGGPEAFRRRQEKYRLN